MRQFGFRFETIGRKYEPTIVLLSIRTLLIGSRIPYEAFYDTLKHCYFDWSDVGH